MNGPEAPRASGELLEKQLAFTNTLLFETPGGWRYTQDSPILPNVWLAYAVEPRSQQELILTVKRNRGTGQTARELRKMLRVLRSKRPTVGDINPIERKRARVSYIPGQIAAKLYFDELMRVILPLTPWWHETYDYLKKIEKLYGNKGSPADWTPFPQPDDAEKREQDLTEALMLMRREIDPFVEHVAGLGKPTKAASGRLDYIREIPAELSWLVRISGLIGDCFSNDKQLLNEEDSLSSKINLDFEARDVVRQIVTSKELEELKESIRLDQEEALDVRRKIVQGFVHLYENWCLNCDYPDDRLIWRVTKNRRVHLAVAKSALTVKADAAWRLFDISCRNICWAVVDSGIDPKHHAFKLTTSEHERELRRRRRTGKGAKQGATKIKVDDLDSRIVATLDFTRLRELLDYDVEADLDDGEDEELEQRKERIIADITQRILCKEDNKKTDLKRARDKAAKLLGDLHQRIEDGKDVDWQDLEEAIVVNNPPVPINDHGTHVAGILAADWIEDIAGEHGLPLEQRTRRMRGICPDINLIDVRVFREDGLTDEFELLAAIQFLRWMNSRAGTMQVHGANLSLSLIHEVRRFACGQTPICDECNEASALGMVIVAAAGNRGFEMEDMDEVKATDSYKSVSITDPGNAANVITVGATHRKRPHEYGVSYFSSRGPTGDGRLKPDIVAPGEKIKGPTPNGRAEFKDGTSMAAPHVSGVAAMIMARHTELIAQPERIKSILCNTATDLERERYFQGHGLVDALRALQSV